MGKTKYRFNSRSGEPIKLADGMRNVFSQYKIQEKLTIIDVRLKWLEKMGEAINKKTSYIELHRGTLRIKLNSSVLKNELSFKKNEIKILLNEAIGEDVITSVILD